MGESGEKLRQPISNKAIGVIYMFISILVLLVGYIAHLSQTLVINPESAYEMIVKQLDIFFIEYVFVGFFAGMFVVAGFYYLRRSGASEPTD